MFYESHIGSELSNRLVYLLNANDLHEIITEPTRITPTSESLLDLIITDSPGYILSHGVTQPICRVDHHGVFCKFKLAPNRGGTFHRTVYNYGAADYAQLRTVLSYAPWDSGIDLFDDINEC